MTNEHQDGEREAYTYSPQDGDNGHCFAAQVWDADGNSVAIVDGKDANEANARAKMITEALNARARLDKAAVEPVPVDAGETSDGYHTFNELYEHRHRLFIALCSHVDSWKSRLHDDGSFLEGWFIAGISTPQGKATYHLPNRLWDDLKAQEVANAPKWDGHTSNDVLDRLKSLASLPAPRGVDNVADVSEEAGKCEVLDQQAVSDALATYNESYGNGVDKGQCIRRAIRKYLDTLGLDAEGRPYAIKQRLGGKSEATTTEKGGE